MLVTEIGKLGSESQKILQMSKPRALIQEEDPGVTQSYKASFTLLCRAQPVRVRVLTCICRAFPTHVDAHTASGQHTLLHTSTPATTTYLPEMCGKYSSHMGHTSPSQLRATWLERLFLNACRGIAQPCCCAAPLQREKLVELWL